MMGNSALDRFLTTDPRDAGCGETQELLHVYVELALSGEDPEERFPGITVHLRECHPCKEDFDGLVAAVLGLEQLSR
jgi:hypothetical protein